MFVMHFDEQPNFYAHNALLLQVCNSSIPQNEIPHNLRVHNSAECFRHWALHQKFTMKYQSSKQTTLMQSHQERMSGYSFLCVKMLTDLNNIIFYKMFMVSTKCKFLNISITPCFFYIICQLNNLFAKENYILLQLAIPNVVII